MSLPGDMHQAQEVCINVYQLREKAAERTLSQVNYDSGLPYSPLPEALQVATKTRGKKEQQRLLQQKETPGIFLGATQISAVSPVRCWDPVVFTPEVTVASHK